MLAFDLATRERTVLRTRGWGLCDPMSSDVVVGIIGAAALVLATILGVPRIVRDPLTPIQRQLEIYRALPKDSPARESILRRIEEQVESLDSEATARRNPSGIALGVAFILIAVASGWFIWSAGGWWWILSPVAATAALFGVIGLFQGLEKTPRAANGQALHYQRRQAEKLAAKAGRASVHG